MENQGRQPEEDGRDMPTSVLLFLFYSYDLGVSHLRAPFGSLYKSPQSVAYQNGFCIPGLRLCSVEC